jgi:Rrf2 family transcriptional regulator, nitric oxide-sensitive transcriptional repressor
MHLTRHSDYTMRLLMHLAVQPDRTATIREIAQRFRISRNHMMKVANGATQAGYITAVRGRVGGLKLATSPDEINLGDVLRNTENWTILECFQPATNKCRIVRACGLRPVLEEALEAYFAVLDRYSLADIVQHKHMLVQLLGLKSA